MDAFLRDESGASSSEYALVLGVIGVGVGAATLALGANVGSSMNGKVGDFDVAYSGSSGGPGGGGPGSPGGSTDPGTGGTDTGGDTGPGNGGNNGNGGNGGNNGKNK